MPVFDMLERMMMKRLNFPPGIALRLLTRSTYVGEICYFSGIKLTYASSNYLKFAAA
jgi:hypothetical protein